MSNSGKLYVFEGPDGVGKTTLARALVKHFLDEEVSCDYCSFPGAEPDTLGRFVYELHHRASNGQLLLDPTSLQLLHVAAHIDTIQSRIRPALAAGRNVVLDRFWWSTWVYGEASGARLENLDTMIALEQAHWNEIAPYAVFLISRTAPLDEAHTPLWEQMARSYEHLAQKESSAYPVHRIANEGSAAEAIVHVCKYLG